MGAWLLDAADSLTLPCVRIKAQAVALSWHLRLSLQRKRRPPRLDFDTGNKRQASDIATATRRSRKPGEDSLGPHYSSAHASFRASLAWAADCRGCPKARSSRARTARYVMQAPSGVPATTARGGVSRIGPDRAVILRRRGDPASRGSWATLKSADGVQAVVLPQGRGRGPLVSRATTTQPVAARQQRSSVGWIDNRHNPRRAIEP